METSLLLLTTTCSPHTMWSGLKLLLGVVRSTTHAFCVVIEPMELSLPLFVTPGHHHWLPLVHQLPSVLSAKFATDHRG
ncbi:hypothetical protein Hanom_Chr16g01473901 [Helianthus anomalus]